MNLEIHMCCQETYNSYCHKCGAMRYNMMSSKGKMIVDMTISNGVNKAKTEKTTKEKKKNVNINIAIEIMTSS